MDVNETTPREIIRGVLTTTSVSKSARSVRPRTTPRAVKVRETPVNPPSQAEVASRMLTRSRSANKRKAPLASATTPSDSTTPRTLVSYDYNEITGKISAQPHTFIMNSCFDSIHTNYLCEIVWDFCTTHVWGCTEMLPDFVVKLTIN